MSDVDPLRHLSELARTQSEQIVVPEELRGEVSRYAAPRRRHPRRTVALAIGSVTLAIGGGVGIAALLREQPSRPEFGPACRAAPSLDSNIVALAPNTDPIAGCGALWKSGVLPGGGESSGEVPSLVACIGPGGLIEVFPGPSDFCAALGLSAAAGEMDAETEAIGTLSQRVADEVNLAECASLDDVRTRVQGMLDELGLEGWSFNVSDQAASGDCVKAQLDSSLRVIYLAIL